MPPKAASATGAEAHLRALEALYASAPVNRLFQSQIELPIAGWSRIRFTVREDMFHAAKAAHGTLYFKMLDDAAFYAANGLVSDRFLLTTAFNLHFTKPMQSGEAVAEGRWISGRRRVFVAEARIVEFGTGLRPAFPDNLPRVSVAGTQISVNGLYRHGFLIAPALAEMTVAYVTNGVIDNEVMQCN